MDKDTKEHITDWLDLKEFEEFVEKFKAQSKGFQSEKEPTDIYLKSYE